VGYETIITRRDSLAALRQDANWFTRGLQMMMPSVRSQARWPEAIVITVALWLFVALIFLPLIMKRHEGEGWESVVLDLATIPVSMLFALPMFAAFRRTLDWSQEKRAAVLVGTVLLTAFGNVMFDLFFQAWVANHLETAWASLPTDLGRAYPSFFNYILVFGINMALFQVSFSRRAALKQELQLSRARSAAQQAQLAALRYQLNPHFLFNALNSISALIVTKRNDDAERMTDKLSNFLRSSLNADPSELIMLDEELAITEEYLDIESVRFGERLTSPSIARRAPVKRSFRASSSSRWSKMRSSMAWAVARDGEHQHSCRHHRRRPVHPGGEQHERGGRIDHSRADHVQIDHPAAPGRGPPERQAAAGSRLRHVCDAFV
jgi:hypothetical protein